MSFLQNINNIFSNSWCQLDLYSLLGLFLLIASIVYVFIKFFSNPRIRKLLKNTIHKFTSRRNLLTLFSCITISYLIRYTFTDLNMYTCSTISISISSFIRILSDSIASDSSDKIPIGYTSAFAFGEARETEIIPGRLNEVIPAKALYSVEEWNKEVDVPSSLKKVSEDNLIIGIDDKKSSKVIMVKSLPSEPYEGKGISLSNPFLKSWPKYVNAYIRTEAAINTIKTVEEEGSRIDVFYRFYAVSSNFTPPKYIRELPSSEKANIERYIRLFNRVVPEKPFNPALENLQCDELRAHIRANRDTLKNKHDIFSEALVAKEKHLQQYKLERKIDWRPDHMDKTRQLLDSRTI